MFQSPQNISERTLPSVFLQTTFRHQDGTSDCFVCCNTIEVTWMNCSWERWRWGPKESRRSTYNASPEGTSLKRRLNCRSVINVPPEQLTSERQDGVICAMCVGVCCKYFLLQGQIIFCCCRPEKINMTIFCNELRGITRSELAEN